MNSKILLSLLFTCLFSSFISSTPPKPAAKSMIKIMKASDLATTINRDPFLNPNQKHFLGINPLNPFDCKPGCLAARIAGKTYATETFCSIVSAAAEATTSLTNTEQVTLVAFLILMNKPSK